MPRLANLVQQTQDYEQFTFLNANRDQNRGHIESLKRAFEEVGNLTKVQPILVNDRYQIIDGQHRFIACKELGLPIFFTVVSGLGVREARSMNILHRPWRTEDYAKSYAETGDQNYTKYLELKEDYGLSHSIILAYVFDVSTGNAGGNSAAFRTFREGNLVIEDEVGVRARLDKLAELGEFTNLVNHRSFALAMLKIMNGENYNQRRMVNKVRIAGERLLKKYAIVEDNLRMLEEIYNYGQAEANRSRLY